jgi:hypothetical protein
MWKRSILLQFKFKSRRIGSWTEFAQVCPSWSPCKNLQRNVFRIQTIFLWCKNALAYCNSKAVGSVPGPSLGSWRKIQTSAAWCILWSFLSRQGETPGSSGSETKDPYLDLEAQNVQLFTYWKNFFFLANAFITPFHMHTMYTKPFYTQQHCYVSLKTLYPGGIQTRVFLFLRRMRCPVRHATRAQL